MIFALGFLIFLLIYVNQEINSPFFSPNQKKSVSLHV